MRLFLAVPLARLNWPRESVRPVWLGDAPLD
jgi:hypothetical protein